LINSECLNVFEKRLSQKVMEQLVKLDADIESAKRRAASKGLSQSGAMVNEVIGLCKALLELRVDYIFELSEKSIS
jgi:hypothetical protein